MSLIGHGGPDMGWGPWEERRFASSSLGSKLGLARNFSVREYVHTPPAKAFATDPIVRAFAEWTFLLWRDAWRDIAESSRHAARVAGVPEPAVYGNSANAAISIMESAWQSVKWIEIAWGGPSALTFKLSQAQLRGAGNYTGTWRVAGLRSGMADRYGARGVLSYLAEALSNDGNEELLEWFDWTHVPQCLASAQLTSTHRSVFIDRTRIADGAIVYCLACTLWRQTGVLSPQPDQHTNAVAWVSGTLEHQQVLYEIALFGHARFWKRDEGLARLKLPPSSGGYNWIILPSVDAMSDSDLSLVTAYVRGGGHAVIIDDRGAGYATGIHTEDLVSRCNTTGCGLADLKRNPGAGRVTVLSTISWPAISAAINRTAAPSVSVTGLTPAQSFNAWLHGLGPMLSVQVVNFNFSAAFSMPSFRVTVRTPALAAADKPPIARLFSIDFPNQTGSGTPLPIARADDGKGWVVTVRPPPPPPPRTCSFTVDHFRKGIVRRAATYFYGHVPTVPTVEACGELCCQTATCKSWAFDTTWVGGPGFLSCVHGKPCCSLASLLGVNYSYTGTMNITTGTVPPAPPSPPRTCTYTVGAPAQPCVDVHAIVVLASSEAELEMRAVAAEGRMWLQKAVLASSSHGTRLLATDGAARPNAMPVLTAADQALGQIQGEHARAFADDDPVFQELRRNLNTSIDQLQGLMNDTQRGVGHNEATRRLDHLQMCAKPGSCLAAVNFVSNTSRLAAVSGYTAVGPRSAYSAASGLGFLNENDAVKDARVGFQTKLPDELHRSGIFNSYRSLFRMDVDLSSNTDGQPPPPSSLLLTLISGFDDLGSPTTAAGTGSTFGPTEAGRETKWWMGFASTAVSVIVRPADGTATAGDTSVVSAPAVPCMLGETGRPNGYFLTRTCRINVSSAMRLSPKGRLQIDLVLAPQNGMTGCWSGLCGKLSFAWLLNGLVLQRPTVALGLRARASLAAADAYAAAAVRTWSWVGPL
jgi:hypothetical protein